MLLDDLRFPARTFEVPGDRAPVTVRWLGTAGFALEHAGYVVLIDPYATRASLRDVAFRTLQVDEVAVARFFPEAHAIVCGHTHFDHALDVPSIARRTGAKVFGSRSCAALCRAAGVPESQVTDVESSRRVDPLTVEVGPFTLRFVPSVHSAFALGRIPFPGDIADCDGLPLPARHYKCGAVFGVDVRVAGRRIYHLGSADLLDGIPERDVDLLLMCVAGWTTTERFPQRVMGAFRPRAILLSHWDDFFRPIERGVRALPAMRMPTLVDRLTAIDPSVALGAVDLLGEVHL